MAAAPKVLVSLVCLSVSCLGRDYWNGTKEGMSKAELMKRFGTLTASRQEGIYTVNQLQPFCGGSFKLTFGFDPTVNKGLVWEQLDLKSGNTDGTVGECALRQYTAKFGRPKNSPNGLAFAGDRIELYVSPAGVTILYRGNACSFWKLLRGRNQGCGIIF